MLTKRQKEVLDFVKSYSQKNDYSPTLEEIADYLGVSSIGTVYDHLKKLESGGYIKREQNKPRSIDVLFSSETMVKIPLRGLIAAGSPMDAVEEKEVISIPKTKLPRNKEVFALRVEGDSMIEDGIEEGDVVVVKKQSQAQNGDTVVALIDHGEATLKKFYKGKNGIELKPANKHMEPILLEKDDPVDIRGVVVSVVKQNELQIKTKKVVKSKPAPKQPPLNQIITGDVIEEMQKIPSESIHLAITSPPYNVGKDYDSHDDQMSYRDYLDWLYEVWKETRRVLVPGGRFALNIAPTGIKEFVPLHHDFTNQFRKMGGMKFRTEILWYKQTMLKRTAWGSFKSPSNPHIVPSWEYVLIFSNGQNQLKGDKRRADITKKEFIDFSDGFWQISPETQRKGHPAPFPEELIYRLIKFYSYKGNNVLDMFGGTGTVAAVSAKTNRNFVHIDVSKDYNKIAEKRLKKTLAEISE